MDAAALPEHDHRGELAAGGHFGAWEQPDLFVDEVRALARSLLPE